MKTRDVNQEIDRSERRNRKKEAEEGGFVMARTVHIARNVSRIDKFLRYAVKVYMN